MKLGLIVLSVALLALSVSDALAEPKSSTGVACNKSGSQRHVGTGSDGKKYDCMMDYCTYCGTTSGTIDCSKQVTEWSNATDCKPVAKIGANQSIINQNIFGMQQQTVNGGGGGNTGPKGKGLNKNIFGNKLSPSP